MISPKFAIKGKIKYSKTAGSASIGSASSENCKPIQQLDDLKQLSLISGGVHSYKYVRQAVYGFHVAASRYPYHFCEWLCDSSGNKVDFILADFAGREYNIPLPSKVFCIVSSVSLMVPVVP